MKKVLCLLAAFMLLLLASAALAEEVFALPVEKAVEEVAFDLGEEHPQLTAQEVRIIDGFNHYIPDIEVYTKPSEAEAKALFPAQLNAKFEDGGPEELVDVTWSCPDYDSKLTGEFVFTSALVDTENYQLEDDWMPTAKLYVAEVIGIDPVAPGEYRAGSKIGDTAMDMANALGMPTTLNITLHGASTRDIQAAITWECADYASRDDGEFIFTAAFSGQIYTLAGGLGMPAIMVTIGTDINDPSIRVSPVADQTWTGEPITPKPVITQDSYTLVEGVDYDLAYTDNINVGTATITVTGKGNYRGTYTLRFSITEQLIIEQSITDDSIDVSPVADQPRTGEPIMPKPVITQGSYTLIEGVDYDLTYDSDTNVNVGVSKITITGKGSYYGTRTEWFRIVKGALTEKTIEVYFKNSSGITKVYDKTRNLYITSSAIGFIGLEGNDKASINSITGSYPSAAAGEYDVDITFTLNTDWMSRNNFNYTYKLRNSTITIKGVITRKTLTITPPADQGKVYGEADPTIKARVSGLMSGDIRSGALSREPGEDVGRYRVTLGTITVRSTFDEEGESSYVIDLKEGYFTIFSNSISDESVVMDALADQMYTEGAIEPAVILMQGGYTLMQDTDYVVEYADNIEPGTATVTITGIGKYTGTRTATFSIIPETIITLPGDLKLIDEEAFAGIGAAKIIVPYGCESIGPRAFADCPWLEYIFIPGTVETIDDTAFENSPNVKIGTNALSIVEWARAHGLWPDSYNDPDETPTPDPADTPTLPPN